MHAALANSSRSSNSGWTNESSGLAASALPRGFFWGWRLLLCFAGLTTVTGNASPSVTISSPTNGQVIVGQSVSITGTAVPAGDAIDLVQIYAGTALIAESTNAAFQVLWQGVAPGAHTLTAV